MNDRIGIAAIVIVSLALLFLIVGAWWVNNAKDEVLAAMNAGLIAIIVLTIVGIIIGLICYILRATHLIKLARAEVRRAMAEAKRAERDAAFSVVKARGDEQVYIAETDHSLEWRAAHRDPRIYANGQWTEPTTIEIGTYLAYLESLQPRIAEQVVDGLLDGPPMPLLDTIASFERMLIVGGSGSGKTTLLQWVISRRQGEVIVIDPHDDKHTWPGNAQVIGGGQDYDSIERALWGLVEQTRERYQERAGGNRPEFTWLTLVVDEWREIVQNTKDSAGYIKTILTGGRKVAMGTVVGTHSERARPLGIEGEADLKDGFCIVRLHGNQQVGFSATLDTGEGEVPVTLPGPYHPSLSIPSLPTAHVPALDISRVRLPMSDQERQILQLHKAGETISRIGELVYGQRGGWQSDRVREVLAKFRKS